MAQAVDVGAELAAHCADSVQSCGQVGDFGGGKVAGGKFGTGLDSSTCSDGKCKSRLVFWGVAVPRGDSSFSISDRASYSLKTCCFSSRVEFHGHCSQGGAQGAALT
ncbi:hypothetical protein D3C77_488420 [compost metagenome]